MSQLEEVGSWTFAKNVNLLDIYEYVHSANLLIFCSVVPDSPGSLLRYLADIFIFSCEKKRPVAGISQSQTGKKKHEHTANFFYF
jgi:hypothetical protein